MKTTILTGIVTLVTVAFATQPLKEPQPSDIKITLPTTEIHPDNTEIWQSIERIKYTQEKTDELIEKEASHMKPETP